MYWKTLLKILSNPIAFTYTRRYKYVCDRPSAYLVSMKILVIWFSFLTTLCYLTYLLNYCYCDCPLLNSPQAARKVADKVGTPISGDCIAHGAQNGDFQHTRRCQLRRWRNEEKMHSPALSTGKWFSPTDSAPKFSRVHQWIPGRFNIQRHVPLGHSLWLCCLILQFSTSRLLVCTIYNGMNLICILNSRYNNTSLL